MAHSPSALGALLLLGFISACSSSNGSGSGGSGGHGATSSTAGVGGSVAGTTSAGTDATTSTGSGPTCGDSTCDAGETCTSCPGDCGACPPIPCPKDGGVYCGGNGVGGNPNTLYVCQSGALAVLQECTGPCVQKPNGVPDQCPGSIDVPASLIAVIDSTPYVEGNCVPTTYPGWPYDAQACTYTSGGITTTVKVANPSPDRVGRWIVDSATYIPALQALKTTAPGAYEDGLGAIGLAMLYQSSRIFALQGGIIEDMGGGYVNYQFEDGVSQPCSSGCYCRINSLHRTEWCSYREGLGESYDACIAKVGAANHTPEWGAECLSNHVAAWTSDSNEHFRAKAYVANKSVSASCPPGQCSAGAVVAAVKSAYGL